MKQQCHYLVVDDDSTSNLICDYIIQRFDKAAQKNLFKDPREALDFIKERGPQFGVSIVLLDVNMPVMSGFDFLIEFEKFSKEIKDQYVVYMLTSSIEDFSSQARKFTVVKGFFSKPLKLSHLEKIHIELEGDLATRGNDN